MEHGVFRLHSSKSSWERGHEIDMAKPGEKERRNGGGCFNEIAVMPCKWLGNSFRGFLCPAAGLHAGLTRFHTYFNTAETVRKLRDMHKRLRKLGYSVHPTLSTLPAQRKSRWIPLDLSFLFRKKKKKEKKGTIKNNRGDETRSKLKIFHGTIISFLYIPEFTRPCNGRFFHWSVWEKKLTGHIIFPATVRVNGTMYTERCETNDSIVTRNNTFTRIDTFTMWRESERWQGKNI